MTCSTSHSLCESLMDPWNVCVGGTTHDALTARCSTSLPTYICDGKVDLMDYEVAQGRTSEKEGALL